MIFPGQKSETGVIFDGPQCELGGGCAGKLDIDVVAHITDGSAAYQVFDFAYEIDQRMFCPAALGKGQLTGPGFSRRWEQSTLRG